MLEKEMRRMENQKNRQTSQTDTDSEMNLKWNDVTISVFERAEQDLCEPNDSEKATMLHLGNMLVSLSEELFNVIESLCRAGFARKLSIYREYVASDKITLSDLGAKYDVSRERIRQIVSKANDGTFYEFKKVMVLNYAEFNKSLFQIAELLENIDYNLPSLLSFGLASVGNRKKSAILHLLFGKEIAEMLLKRSKTFTAALDAHKELQKINEEIQKTLDRYLAKTCFPSSFTADPTLSITAVEKKRTYDFEKKARLKLLKLLPLVDIIENPDIVYCSTSQTDHRPHALLRLSDGRSILVLILPAINMAYIYNIQRFNELHQFCVNNGYGYLIIDDNDNSIYDLKNRAIANELTDALNAVLDKKGQIDDQSLSVLRSAYKLSKLDIASYVLQNKLHFSPKPFCIKKRKAYT
jgi:hypothetical protein